MTDKFQGSHHPAEGKLPVVITAGQLNRHDSGQAAPAKRPGFAVTPGKLKEALVYRWKSSLVVGLIFACVGVVIAWVTYAPKYTAVTAMRIGFTRPGLLPLSAQSEQERTTEKRQKNEAQIIRSREVLRAVLRRDAIRSSETIRSVENPIEWLEKELQAGFVPGTDFFRIALSGEHPKDIALIVNALREVYKNQYVNLARKQQAEHLDSVIKVMGESEEKIRKERNVLRGLAETFDTGELQVLTLKQKIAVEEFGDRRRELSHLDAEIRRNVALLVIQEGQLKALQTEGFDKLPEALVEQEFEKHPRMLQVQFEIARIEDQIKEYAKSITGPTTRLGELESHLKTARSHMEKVKKDILPAVSKKILNKLLIERTNSVALTKEKLSVAREQRKEIVEIVDKRGKEAAKIGLGTFDIEIQRSTIEQHEATLRALRAEKERLEIERSSERDTIIQEQIAEEPTINQASLLKSGSLYALGGLLLGLLGVSYIEARLHRVHRSAQVDQELGIPILGVLPLLTQKNARPYGEARLASESIPDVLFADAVNNLCARLLCDDRLTKSSVVMVTSAAENEGKTMLATQLAAGLARLGRRTLLLDCDFRNSRCPERLGLLAGPGLGDVLCGEAEIADVLQTVPDSDARVLTAGKSNPQVIKALNNGKFAALLLRFRQEFDCIIVDSAPTPVVSDGLLIGKLSDGVILVVRPKVSKAAEVLAAFDQLAALRIPILGSVVNANLSSVSGKYYK